MQFVVDRVSEDSFFANLLLGLPDVLQDLGIETMILERHNGLSECEILQWEMKYGVRLPEDLRAFYIAMDGFRFTWYTTTVEEDHELPELAGKIDIHSLRNVQQMFGYETKNDFDVEVVGNRYVLSLGMESKLFVLETLDIGRIVLVYLKLKYLPTIWLCTKKMEFYFLADDFTTYLRMSIAHLGLPEWQLTFSPHPVSEMAKEFFQIYIPHIFPLQDRSELLFDNPVEHDPDSFVNQVDSDFLLVPAKTPPQASQAKVSEQPSTSKKPADKKKVLRPKPPTKFKRKPLYYIK